MAKKPTNTKELTRLKRTLTLSEQQFKLIVGTILGDGCLITSRSGRSARLQIRHNIKHREFVDWKYSFMNDWVLTAPRFDRFNDSWYFRTLCHPELMEIKKIFYKGNQRVIPLNISEILKSPLSLAVWIMDDGNGSKRSKYFRISSYGFGLEGNKLLKKALEENFSLRTTIYSDSKGYQLFFPKVSAFALHKIVRPHLVDCMRYKFANLTP
jgi:hypothetical protein